MRSVLGVFAHREDHIVCGWPWMQDKSIDRYLLRCTDDYDELVGSSCREAGITYVGNLGLCNSFASAAARCAHSDAASAIIGGIRRFLATHHVDAICTHNPWGEYGHYDHRLVFSVVYGAFPFMRCCVSDVKAISSYYVNIESIPREYRPLYSGLRTTVSADDSFYAGQAKLFTDAGAWTKNANLNQPAYPTFCKVVELP